MCLSEEEGSEEGQNEGSFRNDASQLSGSFLKVNKDTPRKHRKHGAQKDRL